MKDLNDWVTKSKLYQINNKWYSYPKINEASDRTPCFWPVNLSRDPTELARLLTNENPRL